MKWKKIFRRILKASFLLFTDTPRMCGFPECKILTTNGDVQVLSGDVRVEDGAAVPRMQS